MRKSPSNFFNEKFILLLYVLYLYCCYTLTLLKSHSSVFLSHVCYNDVLCRIFIVENMQKSYISLLIISQEFSFIGFSQEFSFIVRTRPHQLLLNFLSCLNKCCCCCCLLLLSVKAEENLVITIISRQLIMVAERSGVQFGVKSYA